MYLAGCRLHIQTVTFLSVLTLKQYANAKTIETLIAVTIIFSLSQLITRPRSQVILEVFPGKQVVFEPSLPSTPGL